MSIEERLRMILGNAPERLFDDYPDLVGQLEAALNEVPRQTDETAGGEDTDESEVTETFHPTSSERTPGHIDSSVIYGDYQLLDQIAHGGMGVVYRARQLSLDRIVALKRIRTGELANQREVDRFYAEARAAAQLKHVGILPVYEVGTCNDQHFFTMELVEGGSLQDRLRDSVMPPRDAAEIVRKVAEAIQHAHDHQIIHRDLKPGNILLDSEGEPKVADFGLAKRIGDDEAHTITGAVIGTLSYMPREQATGELDLVGPASDVYSLGGVLYCLLTGRPPFRAATHAETLRQVMDENPVPLRTLDTSIHKDLETICLKCLRKEVTHRYRSAQGLADDLQRWLHHEPIQARPVGRVEKSWLWCKRKPMTAAVLGLLLLIAVVSPAAAYYQSSLRTKAENSFLDAERQRTLAKENFEKARKAIDDYFTIVSEDRLLNEPGMQPLRKDLLETALEYYQDFVKHRRDDPEVQIELANAYSRVGEINHLIGSKDVAITSYQQALQILEKLVNASPTVAEYRYRQSKARNNIGVLQSFKGDSEASMESFRQALDINEILVAENPRVTEFQSSLAKSHLNIGNVLASMGDTESALESYRQSLAIEQSIVVPNPRTLANIHNGMGELFHATGDIESALLSREKAIEFQEKLVAENPVVSEYRIDLAGFHNNLGNLRRATRDYEAALRSYQRGLDIKEELAAQNPTVTKYQNSLALSHVNIGNLRTAIGDLAATMDSYRRALEIQKRFGALDSRTLANVHNGMGVLQREAGDFEAARVSHEQAIQIQEKLVADAPTITVYQSDLASFHNNIGDLLESLGEREAALRSFHQALELNKKLLAGNPMDPILVTNLRNTYWRRASLRDELHRYAESASDWNKAIELASGVDRDSFKLKYFFSLARSGNHTRATRETNELLKGPRVAENILYDGACVFSICSTVAQEDAALDESERIELAEQYAQRAVALLKQLQAGGFFNSQNVEHLKNDDDLAPLRSREEFQRLLRDSVPRPRTVIQVRFQQMRHHRILPCPVTDASQSGFLVCPRRFA